MLPTPDRGLVVIQRATHHAVAAFVQNLKLTTAAKKTQSALADCEANVENLRNKVHILEERPGGAAPAQAAAPSKVRDL